MVDDDPVGAWHAHVDAVQALLDEPATANLTLSNPHIGQLPLDSAIDQFYSADVFMHTWDLARATGQDDRLDPDFCDCCSQAWNRWRRSFDRPANMDPECRSRTMPTPRPSCSASSAGSTMAAI